MSTPSFSQSNTLRSDTGHEVPANHPREALIPEELDDYRDRRLIIQGRNNQRKRRSMESFPSFVTRLGTLMEEGDTKAELAASGSSQMYAVFIHIS